VGRKHRQAAPIEARQLQGFKYFRMVAELFDSLHEAGTLRDRAGNRQLFFDQYALLMLLYYFNPIVESLRGLAQITELSKVQKLCGVRKTSLGSLSEAANVFDPTLLEPIIAELGGRALRASASLPKAHEAALAGLIAVDGSLLRVLPRMAWALWQDGSHGTHRAAKMHVAFAVFPALPVQVAVTAGNGSEREQWRRMAKPGGFYVADRGYADYSLFRELDALDCRFVVRVQENAVFEVAEERPLSAEDAAAGVVRDAFLRRLGTEKHNSLLTSPLRIVVVQGTEPDHQWVLATNVLTLSAELIAQTYHYRWQIELFFRWLKCVLGCRHLLSQSASGVTLHVYFAIIASLLIGLWIGTKPNKRTYEMLCLYLSGWATAEEVDRHLIKLRNTSRPP
jgi:hypothetical protein